MTTSVSPLGKVISILIGFGRLLKNYGLVGAILSKVIVTMLSYFSLVMMTLLHANFFSMWERILFSKNLDFVLLPTIKSFSPYLTSSSKSPLSVSLLKGLCS